MREYDAASEWLNMFLLGLSGLPAVTDGAIKQTFPRFLSCSIVVSVVGSDVLTNVGSGVFTGCTNITELLG